jgi:hypothetical protein
METSLEFRVSGQPVSSNQHQVSGTNPLRPGYCEWINYLNPSSPGLVPLKRKGGQIKRVGGEKQRAESKELPASNQYQLISNSEYTISNFQVFQ